MRRQQKYCTQSRGGALVDLSLQYDGNQLKKVTDQCGDLTYAGAMDFKDGADKTVEYEWDANGNMTRDRNKRISSIRYNVLNLPERINYEDGHIVSYTYAADGRKLRVKYLVNNIAAVEVHSAGSAVTGAAAGLMGGPIPFNPGDTAITPGITPGLNLYTTLLTMDYCGNHVYRNGVLERTMNDYGYHADSTYYYYIKDYQGNVRAVIDQSGVLKEVNNYYPYGGLMGAASAGVQPHKYGGKELDRQNGIDWYDFEARYQDPMLPMFTTQDPLAEQTPGVSPYAYCAGNPVRYIDPSGMRLLLGIDGTLYEYRMGEDGRFAFYSQQDNSCYTGNDEFANSVINSLSSIIDGEAGYDLVMSLINTKTNVTIQKTNYERKTIGGGNEITVRWKNGYSVGPSFKNGKYSFDAPAFVSLAHEFGHALDLILGTIDQSEWFRVTGLDGKEHIRTKSEWFACFVENAVRLEHQLPFRTHYGIRLNMNNEYEPEPITLLPYPSDLYKFLFPKGSYVYSIANWLLQ